MPLPNLYHAKFVAAARVDIHHIDSRGMGGSNKKDFIENLMGVCRNCHNAYGDIETLKNKLKQVHLKFMEIYGTVNKI